MLNIASHFFAPSRKHIITASDGVLEIELRGLLALIVESVVYYSWTDREGSGLNVFWSTFDASGSEGKITQLRTGYPCSPGLTKAELVPFLRILFNNIFIHEVDEGFRNVDGVCFFDPHPELEK